MLAFAAPATLPRLAPARTTAQPSGGSRRAHRAAAGRRVHNPAMDAAGALTGEKGGAASTGTKADAALAGAKEGTTERAAAGALATLLVACPDQKGVVAVVAQLLFGYGCNIVSSEQFTDSTASPPRYYQRVEFDYSDLRVAAANVAVLERSIADLAERYDMWTRLTYHHARKRVAVLVSKTDHCLYDLLLRHRSRELPRSDVSVVISNHPDLRRVAEHFGIPFAHCPIDKSREDWKAAQEARVEEVMAEYGADCVVLARYMQIMSPEFCAQYAGRCINIHHSFLPSFVGGKPYHQAHARGVKIIGATAHFVSEVLDEGPIIHQSVTRVSHRDSPSDMVRKGRDLERVTLGTAVRWFLDDRILVQGGRTVVFED
jgi:formyltetrahydrofolate deformylase